jgi:hypothetical protein
LYTLTYICPNDAETSGHNRSMFSLSLRSAKLCKAGSGSARKPTRPAADVKPTMANILRGYEDVLEATGAVERRVVGQEARSKMMEGAGVDSARKRLSKLRRARLSNIQGQVAAGFAESECDE